MNSLKSVKLAFVIPRYGASIGGGAETLMRKMALELKNKSIVVDILTSCASDHRTWENDLPEGETIEDGLVVRRFKVDPRNIGQFLDAERKIHSGYDLSNREQIGWIQNSVNSKTLYQFISENSNKYNLFFFAPYLFGTSFWGTLLVPKKAILVPCLHDEGYAYLPIIRTMFRKAKGIMWNAVPESKLAEKIYSLPSIPEKGFTVGMGFSIEVSILPSLKKRKSYLLYSGRKESGKGLDLLIEFYRTLSFKKDLPELVLIGSGEIDFIETLPKGVVDLGFVSEEDKLVLMRDAICLFQPSVNESFSIVIMEAWSQKTPVVVNSDCPVTRYHVEESKGGLHYRGQNGFDSTVEKILSNTIELEKMGSAGFEFVNAKYSWESTIERFNTALNYWLRN